jgi:hypothetical protein
MVAREIFTGWGGIRIINGCMAVTMIYRITQAGIIVRIFAIGTSCLEIAENTGVNGDSRL